MSRMNNELDTLSAEVNALKRLRAESRRGLHTPLDALLPAILARAFAGQLVPQNPADEPAEKLLEKIQNKTGSS